MNTKAHKGKYFLTKKCCKERQIVLLCDYRVAKSNKRRDHMIRQHIINRRKELMITQSEVAKVAGIARSSYAAIERGLRSPSLRTAQLISMMLHMDINEAFPINTLRKDKESHEENQVEAFDA
jgi:DNA-binding XRE family transcriptional regulator